MKTRKLFVTLFAAITAISLFTCITFASSLEKIRFIKTSSKDEMAVIKEADGKLRVVKPGDRIGDSISVTAISKDRIVLEEKNDKGPETVIVRIDKGSQVIERISKQVEVRPMQGAPQSSSKSAPGAR